MASNADKTIYLVDIDGTLCEHVANEAGDAKMLAAKPFLDSVTEVNKLYDAGNYICFFTARTDDHRKITEVWLAKHRVRYHQIIFNKPRKLPPFSGYHLIDDAHVRATTFRGKFTKLVLKNAVIHAFED